MVFRFLSKAVKTKTHQFFLCQRLSSNAYLKEYMKEKELFHGALPGILDSIASPQLADVPDVTDTIKKILEYNLTGGKCTRGLSTVMSYKFMETPEKITEESMNLSRIMGWSVEMFQAYWIVLDDIIDRSKERRGKPCWYMVPNVGMRAVNDSALIYSYILQTVKRNFEHMQGYPNIIHLFNEALHHTSIGQHMDYLLANQPRADYTLFTKERYELIVKYKTSYYTYVLPVCLGMTLANVTDKNSLQKTQEICNKMGLLFQIQDDFVDCFVSGSISGKSGTDIQEGKCTWLAATTLELCNAAQRKVFTTYYGSPEPAHVEQIKQLYKDLRIDEIYNREEQLRFDEIVRRANDFKVNSRSTEMFLGLLNMIFKRNK